MLSLPNVYAMYVRMVPVVGRRITSPGTRSTLDKTISEHLTKLKRKRGSLSIYICIKKWRKKSISFFSPKGTEGGGGGGGGV